MVYAVVRAGGRQEKVSVGTIVTLDRVKAAAGEKIELPAVLLVDGDKVTHEAAALAGVKVTATVLGNLRDRKSTRLNSSHTDISRMPSSA